MGHITLVLKHHWPLEPMQNSSVINDENSKDMTWWCAPTENSPPETNAKASKTVKKINKLRICIIFSYFSLLFSAVMS